VLSKESKNALPLLKLPEILVGNLGNDISFSNAKMLVLLALFSVASRKRKQKALPYLESILCFLHSK
jgi:hypothetical protein